MTKLFFSLQKSIVQLHFIIKFLLYICIPIILADWEILYAGVVELVDTLDLGSSAARCESSSLSARTT